MTTQLQRPTAQIYTFPTGGRAPPRRIRETSWSAPYALPLRNAAVDKPKVQHGSSWYHEAAVEEECSA